MIEKAGERERDSISPYHYQVILAYGIIFPRHTRCSDYWKGSLLVTLNYGRQLYLLISDTETHTKETIHMIKTQEKNGLEKTIKN